MFDLINHFPVFRGASAVAVVAILLASSPVLGFEVGAVIRSVDLENRVLHVHARGNDHRAKVAEDAAIVGKDGQKLADGLRAKEFKQGAEVTLVVESQNGMPVIRSIRFGPPPATAATPGRPGGPVTTGKASVGLKPLPELAATDSYKGEKGGLYGDGSNLPPEPHRAAAKRETAKIVPLGPDGGPSPSGAIGLISISMSNWTMEFSAFKGLADRDPQKSPAVTIVDCAQGGQAMRQWSDPDGRPWVTAAARLKEAGLTPAQVQVAWIKLANPGPTGDLSEHGKELYRNTVGVLHNARGRFPNLRIAYLESRIYAGYAGSRLNPEPYAYEGAFVVRWLIRDQVGGDPGLNYDPGRGPVTAPLLLWGAYLWADGTTPRTSDGLVWRREDFAADGTHPSEVGRRKVAELLLTFCKTDENVKSWFLKK